MAFVTVIDEQNKFAFVSRVVKISYEGEGGSISKTTYIPPLKEGHSICPLAAPSSKVRANTSGWVAPMYVDGAWAEGATSEEIAAWELDNPAPVVVTEPTEAEQLRADIDFLALMGGVTL